VTKLQLIHIIVIITDKLITTIVHLAITFKRIHWDIL